METRRITRKEMAVIREPKQRRLFRLYDENDVEIGHGTYYSRERNAQVYIGGFVHQVAEVGQALLFEGVVSLRWCCHNGQRWHGGS